MPEYEAAVIGAGPGGLSTVAALLDTGIERILWVDKDFGGGRLNTLYREISSNTKTGIYLDAIHSSKTCTKIVESTPRPHAVSRLEGIDREKTCQLSLAGDMVMMLISGILEMHEGVEKCLDTVESAELDGEQWNIKLASGRTATSSQLHLSTGSHPRTLNIHKEHNPNLKVLDLDHTMVLSSLPSQLPRNRKSTVGIIGNSHSGILACMNFHTIANTRTLDPSSSSESDDNAGEGIKTEYRDVEIINFQRREILFAEYREDGIVWDNSGLKGRTATWAKENMVNNDSSSSASVIKQIRLDRYEGGEEAAYREYLPKCTHLVYAVGYDQSPLPSIIIDGEDRSKELEFDMHTSGFDIPSPSPNPTDTSTSTPLGDTSHSNAADKKDRAGKVRVHGLYGTGIAFPEETEDPEGHVEAAVGLAKFFKFAEKVKGDWGKVR